MRLPDEVLQEIKAMIERRKADPLPTLTREQAEEVLEAYQNDDSAAIATVRAKYLPKGEV